MAQVAYLDSELDLASPGSARFRWEGRNYSGRPCLDQGSEEDLLASESAPDDYGHKLFNVVFPLGSELREGLRGALLTAERDRCRLRLLLHLSPNLPDWVLGLFWELLTDPERRLPPLLLAGHRLLRYLDVREAPEAPITGRARLLCVVAAPTNIKDSGLAEIRRDEVVRRLSADLKTIAGAVDLEILKPPSPWKGCAIVSWRTVASISFTSSAMATIGREAPIWFWRTSRAGPSSSERSCWRRPSLAFVSCVSSPWSPAMVARPPPRSVQRPRRKACPGWSVGCDRHAPRGEFRDSPLLYPAFLPPACPQRTGRRSRQRGAPSAPPRPPMNRHRKDRSEIDWSCPSFIRVSKMAGSLASPGLGPGGGRAESVSPFSRSPRAGFCALLPGYQRFPVSCFSLSASGRLSTAVLGWTSGSPPSGLPAGLRSSSCCACKTSPYPSLGATTVSLIGTE